MNELISKLKQQAGIDYNPDQEGLDLFAELIIQECVDIADEQKKWVEDQEVFNPQDEQWNRARIQQSQRIADKIKLHFGVE